MEERRSVVSNVVLLTLMAIAVSMVLFITGYSVGDRAGSKCILSLDDILHVCTVEGGGKAMIIRDVSAQVDDMVVAPEEVEGPTMLPAEVE